MRTTRLRIVERFAGAMTVLVGAAVLLGWLLDVPVLRSVFPGMATMKATTALCFILSGVAFWIGTSEVRTGTARAVARISLVFVLLVGGLALVENLFGWNLGLDEALFHDAAAGASSSGRMGPNTAAAFVLLGMALFLLPGGLSRPRRAAVGLLGALTALLGLFAVLAWTGAVTVGWGELTTVDLHTGALFLLLGSACAAHAWCGSGLPLAIGSRLSTGFVLGVVVFVALSMLSYQSARQLAETADWVRHTHEVLAKLPTAALRRPLR
jgi:hypothetical protein